MAVQGSHSSGFALTDKTAVENGDPVFTVSEFKNLDVDLKRKYAGRADTDEVDHLSTELEIDYYFCRQKTLTDYGTDS